MAEVQSLRNRDVSESTFRSSAPINVGMTERWVSIGLGSLFLLRGLFRRRGGLLLPLVGGGLLYRGLTGHCHAYGALGMNTAEHPDATAVPAQQGEQVEKSVTIQRSPEDLYRFWRHFENLPRIMRHLVSVTESDSRHSHWVAHGPAGVHMGWDAEILTEREPELIAWRSMEGSEVSTAGSVHFERQPHNQGTLVRVIMKYDPPAGKVGVALAKILGVDLEQQLEEDLNRFKQTMEAGEISAASSQHTSSQHPPTL